MPKVLICDTMYSEALDALHRAHPAWKGLPYAQHLSAILAESFGTSNFYSMHLARLGWQALDAITNADSLQAKWAVDHPAHFRRGDPLRLEIALAQVNDFAPDVLFLQDASLFGHMTLREFKRRGILLASQISCPMPPDENVKQMDVIFTSFPHYVERLRNWGVRRVEYSALAFEPDVLTRRLGFCDRIDMSSVASGVRDLPITFVGGVGADLHWKRGTALLEAVASAFPNDFRWWGYGTERLAADSPLRACYRGEAWGREMYGILGRSRIVVNRHGEVAQGNANCMRLFEATGMGACLLTESAPNLGTLFPAGAVATYDSQEGAVARIRELLSDDAQREGIASAGRAHTMQHHTYARKMGFADRILREELAARSGRK